MQKPSFTQKENAIREVADRFPNNYNAINWLKQNIESIGACPSQLIIDNRYEEFYDSLENLEE